MSCSWYPPVRRNGIVSVIFRDGENGKWLPNSHISGQKEFSNRTIRQFKFKTVFLTFSFSFKGEHNTGVHSVSSFLNCFTTAFQTVTMKWILRFSERNYLTDVFSSQTSYCRNNYLHQSRLWIFCLCDYRLEEWFPH